MTNISYYVYLILNNICKYICVFFYKFLFFNEMMYILRLLFKSIWNMGKRITLFCAFLLIGISLAIAQAVQVTGGEGNF